ncbi:MAG: SDR family oxidoreductase [Desulfobacterales bacterium]|nr:SDR family oxidoreductase [Desulfobacterales bacterium]
MDLGLKGKVALVTGAGQGIGKAIAMTLAEEGCNLAVCARRKNMLDASAEEIRSRGVEVLAVQSDVARRDDNNNFVTKAAEKFGRIDILVNNAGVGPKSDPLELAEEVFRHHMDLMLFGPIQLCKLAIPFMRKRKWGRIINISSIFSKQPGGLLDYDSIKAAMNMWTKDFSNYLARDNILVNSVCPGPVRTPLWDGPGQMAEKIGEELGMTIPQVMKWFAEQNIPLGHHGEPEDIADMVVFLASDRAKFITGQAINVDGGMVKSLV